MKKIDMSSEAITRRLHQTDQLRELSLSLMRAKKESDAKKAELKNNQTGAAQTRSDSSSNANGATAKKTV